LWQTEANKKTKGHTTAIECGIGGVEMKKFRLLALAVAVALGGCAADVRELQEALSKAGIQVDPDGVFGPNTDEAVRAFQRAHDLTPDGIVGPASRSALGL
jgi:peptidoglycan hydrolase-like protein with peptidoglycan-binding domain